MTVLGVAATLAAVAVAPSVAAAKTKQAKFKLSLSGEQATTWVQDEVVEASQDESYSCHGEGSEHVSFATPRPLKVTVKMGRPDAPKDFLWFAFGPGGPAGWGDPELKVEASVDRRSAWTGHEFYCLDLPGEDRSNCTRSAQGVDWWLLLEGDPFEKNRIELADNDVDRDQPDPFPDCLSDRPVLFPDMVFELEGGLVTGKVSRRKIFNRHVKRIAIPAAGNDVESGELGGSGYSGSYQVTESISYTVSLRRIRKK